MVQLSTLPISSADVAKLESSGFLTAEDVVLASVQIAGFSATKSHQIKKLAMRAVALEYVKEMDVQSEIVTFKLIEQNAAVEASVLGILEVDDKRCSISRGAGLVEVSRRVDTPFQFSKAVERARGFITELSRRRVGRVSVKRGQASTEEIKALGASKGFEGFWQEVFAEVRGNEVVKRALTAAIFSTPDEPVHVLVMGDPASAKTVARDIIRSNFSQVTAIGANTTRAGLVCNMASGQLGALAYSNNRLVLIDEFDKIQDDNVEPAYELLSNGTCSVHSARMHKEIVSRFAAIAFANPKTGTFGQYPLRDIGLDPVLMSRFALIARSETLKGEERIELFRGMLHRTPLGVRDIHLFDQWVLEARSFQPEFKLSHEKEERYLQFCSKIVDAHLGTSLRRDLRMGMYMRRIPLAIARASFQDVTDEVLETAFGLIRGAVAQWE